MLYIGCAYVAFSINEAMVPTVGLVVVSLVGTRWADTRGLTLLITQT